MTLLFLLRRLVLNPTEFACVFLQKNHSLQTSNSLELRDFPIQLAPVAPMLADPWVGDDVGFPTKNRLEQHHENRGVVQPIQVMGDGPSLKWLFQGMMQDSRIIDLETFRAE